VGADENESTRSKDQGDHKALGQLRDSKKLSEAKRSACAKWLASKSAPVLMKGPSRPPLYQAACHISASPHIEPNQLLQTQQELAGISVEFVACAIGEASSTEIEELNIWEATQLAISRALSGLDLPREPVALFFDGNLACKLPAALRQVPLITMVKGDDQLRSVSAASILAKVWRDNVLCELDLSFPQYGFAQHKGYGTASHIEAIRSHGMTDQHRPSFLRKALGKLSPQVLGN
jgi:ribonuclease HII